MSRFLEASRTCRSRNPDQAAAKVVALDGLSIIGNVTDNAPAGCDGVGYEATNCFTVTDENVNGAVDCVGTTCPGNSYCAAAGTVSINPAFDFARLIWFGVDHNGAKNCNGDARRSLVDNWSNIFEESCANAGPCGVATGNLPAVVPNYPPAGVGSPGPLVTTMPNLPVTYAQNNGLARVLRRADLSGTTDTFASILGGGTIAGSVVASAALPPFCNGYDRQDGDPIRRRCNAQDAVCGPNVHSGLLQAITVDENHTVAITYPTQSCTPGAFPLLPARRIQKTNFTIQFDCPEKENFSIGGFCFTPVKLPSTNGNAAGDANCWSPPQNVGPTFTDGRVANRYVRAADGVGGLVDNAIIADAGNTQNGFRNDVVNAYYRVRQNTIVAGAPGTPSTLGAAVCQFRDSTENIGCLMSQMRCALGFSGLAALTAGGIGLTVDNIPASDATIQPLGLVAQGTPAPAGTYPIARRLFLSSMDAAVADVDEAALASCYANPAVMSGAAGAVAGAGFIELLPGSITCTDFNETTCNTLAPIACTAAADCGVYPCTSGFCDFSCNGADQAAADATCVTKQPGATCIGWTATTAGRCGFATNSAATCGFSSFP